jgi:hypothetical protein
MSLYNGLFGKNPLNKVLLKMLGLKKEDFGRFRDCYYEDGAICVYARIGGGNRPDYKYVFDFVKKHKNYSCNSDDAFDCTYASIYFNLPEEFKKFKDDLDKVTIGQATPSDKFQEFINKMSEEKK